MKSNETQSLLTEEEIKAYTKRLVLARLRILDKHGFYGIMLMHMKFSLDNNCETAYTDGKKIAFSPKFMDNLSDEEIEFVLMHEILHVALKHCFRGRDYEPLIFNIACDIVVNSNILKSNGGDLDTITLKNFGESMHTINNEEGNEYTAEEVYELLLKTSDVKNYLKNKQKMLKDLENQLGKSNDANENQNKGSELDNRGIPIPKKGIDKYGSLFDDHSKWKGPGDFDQGDIDEVNKLISEAAESTNKRPNAGDVPLGAQRIVEELLHPTIDWRLLLYDFVQNEIIDYSFNPPDARYNDFDFFMPDFNVKDEKVEKILFMVDTSGSIDNQQLTMAYTEIRGAIEQFDNLEGYLGFFDACVYEPLPFTSVDDLLSIKPRGGGGTSFHCIFDYIKNNMEEYPKFVVIITDGYAPHPTEDECLHIPVLWLINNDVITPKYGTVARIKMD